MKFIYLLAFGSVGLLALMYRRRQVFKRLGETNVPTIPKTPAGIETADDATCFSCGDRTIFTSRGVTVIGMQTLKSKN